MKNRSFDRIQFSIFLWPLRFPFNSSFHRCWVVEFCFKTVGIVIFFNSLCWAQVSQDEVLKIAGKYQDNKKRVAQLESQKREILAKLYRFERESKKIAKEKNLLNQNNIKVTLEIREVSKEIIELEEKISKSSLMMKKRSSMSRKLKKFPWFYIFLSNVRPIFLERIEYVFKKMNKQEIDAISNQIQWIAKLKIRKKKLRKLAIQSLKMKKAILQKENSLVSRHDGKKRLLQQLHTQLGRQKEGLLRFRKKGLFLSMSRNLRELKMLFATEFFEKKGHLPIPVRGQLVHGFGLNALLLRSNVKVLQKGHFYKSPAGTPVHSVADGKVRFSGSLKGQGKVVIIEHGSHYYSVYSQMDNQVVKQGKFLKAGSLLGKTGEPHLVFGYGLQFEIRHFSQAENPAHWLSKSYSSENLAYQNPHQRGGI